MLQFTHKTDQETEPELTVMLPWEKRIKSRLRVILSDGSEAGIILARGSFLRGGDILATDDGISCLVKGEPEQISTVVENDPLQMARLCYHLGNRHVSLEIKEGTVSYLHDHVLDEMVVGLGSQVTMETAPFEPEHGAYTGSSGHSHHGHSHE